MKILFSSVIYKSLNRAGVLLIALGEVGDKSNPMFRLSLSMEDAKKLKEDLDMAISEGDNYEQTFSRDVKKDGGDS